MRPGSNAGPEYQEINVVTSSLDDLRNRAFPHDDLRYHRNPGFLAHVEEL